MGYRESFRKWLKFANIFAKVCWAAVSEIDIDTAVAKIGDYKVKYLHEFEFTFEKALTCVSGAQRKLFDEKKTKGRKLVSDSR
jgi:hypothetical protein